MNYTKYLLIAAAIGSSSSLFGSVIVFEEDFSSATLPTVTQANLGFFQSAQAALGTISVSADASIETVNGNEVLELNSTSGFRGIGITLDSAMLAGAGTYNLGVNVIDFVLVGNGSNAATFVTNVYSADGYATGGPNGLVVNAQTGSVTPTSGSDAVSTLLATNTVSFLDPVNTGVFNLEFEYNGTDDAIVIFFGANAVNFPFPQIQIDDIVLTTVVPEPSSTLLLSLGATAFLLRRRRV